MENRHSDEPEADGGIVENANKAFWLQMTKESTVPYCREMLKLSAEGDASVRTPLCQGSDSTFTSKMNAYIDYVVEMTDNGKRKEVIADDSPFPSDIQGYICRPGIDRSFEPSHLMCRLGALRDEVGHMTYEFLIEYDIFQPDVEIYYGVKAVSDNMVTTPEFQRKVITDWQKVRAVKKYVGLSNKFKVTNNGDNGTFWPFWLRLNIDGQAPLEEAVNNLSKFYEDYRRNLSLTPMEPPRFAEVNEGLLRQRHTPEDYERLLAVIGKRFGMEGRKMFEDVFVRNCVEKGYICRCGESCYNVAGIPNYKFSYLARLFFMGLSYLYGEGQIPQKELTKVFLGKKKTYLTASDWGKSENDMPDEWANCEAEVRSWLGLNAKYRSIFIPPISS